MRHLVDEIALGEDPDRLHPLILYQHRADTMLGKFVDCQRDGIGRPHRHDVTTLVPQNIGNKHLLLPFAPTGPGAVTQMGCLAFTIAVRDVYSKSFNWVGERNIAGWRNALITRDKAPQR